MASRPKLYIHIGIGKTGTTAIQAALFDNRDALLEQGVLVPQTGTKNVAHHLFTELGTDQFAPQIAGLYERLVKEQQASSCSRVIISSEFFCFCRPLFIRQVARQLNAFSTEVVFYVRGQAKLIETSYLQAIKTNRPYHGTLAQYFAATKGAWNFQARIRPWVDNFEEQNIRARLYDSRIHGGDIRPDFFSIFGAAGVQLKTDSSRKSNPSLLGCFANLVRLIDDLEPKEVARKVIIENLSELSAQLRNAAPGRPMGGEFAKLVRLIDDLGPAEAAREGIEAELSRLSAQSPSAATGSLMSKELEAEIAAQYRRSNKAFAERFLRDDERVFLME